MGSLEGTEGLIIQSKTHMFNTTLKQCRSDKLKVVLGDPEFEVHKEHMFQNSWGFRKEQLKPKALPRACQVEKASQP